ADHAITVVSGAVGRDAVGDGAGRKTQHEVDRVFDRAEARVGPVGVLDRRDLHRLLAGQIAGGVQAVDPDVLQRPAAGQGLVQSPLRRIAGVEAVFGGDGAQGAQLAAAGDADRLDVVRLE